MVLASGQFPFRHLPTCPLIPILKPESDSTMTETALVETRNTDSKGRITLPKEFANATVIVQRLGDNEIVIRKARVIPEDEARVFDSIPPLSDRDRDAFLAALDRPGKPVKALRDLAKRHRNSKE